MKLFPVVFATIACAAIALADDRLIRFKSESEMDERSNVYFLEYGYFEEKVIFVVFHKDSNRVDKKTNIVSEVDTGVPIIRKAFLTDGKEEINLLAKGGVYQVEKGRVQRVEIEVDASKLSAFLRSRPRELTATQLDLFLKSGPKGQKGTN